MTVKELSNAADQDMRDHYIASRFLAEEAKLLDQRRFAEWLKLVDDEVSYKVYMRLSAIDFDREVNPDAFHVHDDKRNLALRVERAKSGSGWSELPPSRTLRLVGSIMVNRTDRDDVIEVENALNLYRQRASTGPGDLIAVRRTDWLRMGEEGPKLLKRVVIPTDSSLNTPNLGVLL